MRGDGRSVLFLPVKFPTLVFVGLDSPQRSQRFELIARVRDMLEL